MIIKWGFPMPTYEVEMYGSLFNWPNDWTIDKSVKLIDCTFTRLNQDKNVSVRTELKAENESDAKDVGSFICRTESEIFAFCSDTVLLLDSTFVRVKEKASDIGTGFKSFSMDMILAPSTSLTTIQLETSLSRVQETLKQKSRNELSAIERAIRWHALGEMEKESKIDRFIKFWIALEVLANTEKGNDVQRVKNALKTVYPEIAGKIDASPIVGRYIYSVRKEIFHRGKLLSGELQGSALDVDTQLRQLEDILIDLLRHKLGLPPKSLAKRYFV